MTDTLPPQAPSAGEESRHDNAVADLGASTLVVSLTRTLLAAPVTDAVRGPGGLLSAGVVATLVDIAGCQPAMVAVDPDWTATQDLSVHGPAVPLQGPLVLDCRLVRTGSRTAVVGVDVHDGAGLHDLPGLQVALDEGRLPRAGRAHVTFARIPRTAARGGDAAAYRPADWVGEVRSHPLGRRAAVPLAERTGARPVGGPGVLELDNTPYVSNSIGTVQGGLQAVLAQLAAEELLPGHACVDLQVHFLRQSRSGPVRTRPALVREGPGAAVVEVDVVDPADGDRLLTRVVATLLAPQGA